MYCPEPQAEAYRIGNEYYPRSHHVTALHPPPPPPDQEESRAVKFPALTTCDTYAGWGTQILPSLWSRDSATREVRLLLAHIFSEARTTFWLGLKENSGKFLHRAFSSLQFFYANILY